MFQSIIRRIGVLRLLLSLVVITLALAALLAGGETHYSGWRVLPTLIAPAVAPMVVFVLPLDMLMCGVYLSGESGPERSRYRFIVGFDLILLAVLVAAWSPFFYRLIRG